jgi:hypothetical protein
LLKTGILNVGETSGIPIIRELMNENENDQRNISVRLPLPAALALLWRVSVMLIIVF